MNITRLRLGTRGSALALFQAHQVRNAMLRANPALAVEIVPMLTSGDKHAEACLADIGGKALFTKELEDGLLAGTIDFAVHSLKDMETYLPDGLMLAACLEREDPRDAVIGREDAGTLAALASGARVGTSAPRRVALLQHYCPSLSPVALRGNVPTRLKKLQRGEMDAVILALAGLKRLQLAHHVTEILPADRFIPAAGQGIIGIECRRDRIEQMPWLAEITHQPTLQCAQAERAVLAALGGSCRTPAGAHAVLHEGRLHLRSFLATEDGAHLWFAERQGQAGDAEYLGKEAGGALLTQRNSMNISK